MYESRKVVATNLPGETQEWRWRSGRNWVRIQTRQSVDWVKWESWSLNTKYKPEGQMEAKVGWLRVSSRIIDWTNVIYMRRMLNGCRPTRRRKRGQVLEDFLKKLDSRDKFKVVYLCSWGPHECWIFTFFWKGQENSYLLFTQSIQKYMWCIKNNKWYICCILFPWYYKNIYKSIIYNNVDFWVINK